MKRTNIVMLTIKEMSDKFNIPKSTLYGWEKERKEIFEYLQNANSNDDQLRDINILFEHYSKEIVPRFSRQEIEYLLSQNLKVQKIEEIVAVHTIYACAIADEIAKNSEFVMGIYEKLKGLNLIERYLFAKNYNIVKAKISKNGDEKDSLIRHYLKPFLI